METNLNLKDRIPITVSPLAYQTRSLNKEKLLPMDRVVHKKYYFRFMTKQQLVLFAALALCAAACNNTETVSTSNQLVGSWQLVSGTLIKGTDTTFTDYTKNVRMIKILNATHFAFLNHDVNHGKDSANASFVAGGGTYKLEGDKYTEQLDYCSARGWEGNVFDFTLQIQGDTLTQTGVEKIENLGIEQFNIEKYVRINP